MKVPCAKKPSHNKRICKLSNYSWLIIALGIFLNLGIWLFFWQQINYEYDRKIELTSQETMNLCIAFEEHVRRVIADADMDLLNLKQAYEREGIASPVIDDYVNGSAQDSARFQTAIANEHGILVKSFNKIALGVDVSDREYFRVHRDSDSQMLYTGSSLKTKRAGPNVIPLSRRINNPDGSFAGIVFIGLNPEYFLSFYKKIDLGKNQLISLVGKDGIVLARQSGNNLDFGQTIYGSSLWENVQSGQQYGSYVTKNPPEGLKRIVSYRALVEYPLMLAVGKNVQVAFDTVNKRTHNYILGASLVSLFIIAFCYLLVSRAEQRLVLNTELLRLDRLNIVGEMAAGIGHEVRNPMTTVRGYLQMFQRKGDFAKYQEHLQTMIEELDRANSIITEFLSLAKDKTIDITPGDLNETVNTLFPLLQADAFRRGHNIEIATTAIPAIQIDQKEIRQLILNLTRNGLEAMKAGGKLTIRTYLEEDRVILAISDTGPGIPPEIKAKLGTPFFTTKESGTGLGLPVCYRIAQRHEAIIAINTSSQGTTFCVKFPVIPVVC